MMPRDHQQVTKQRLFRTGKAMALAVAVTACSTAPNAEPILTALQPIDIQDVFYATTRAPSQDDQLFSGSHASDTSYGVVRVGIPTGHKPGELSLASGNPDPTRHLHTRAVSKIPSLTAFAQQSVGAKPGAMIFVHGYNNSFVESIYRYAQIAHDTDLPGAAIQFSWASAGEAAAYVGDRDRALLSRYALSELINAVAFEQPDTLVLVAHSMGSLPLMEALAILDDAAKKRLAESVTEIVLVAPDLDIDLFAAQLSQTSIAPAKFAVAINRDDRLLGMSSALSNGRDRLGNKADQKALTQLGVRVFDMTGINDGDLPGHFLPATSPTLLEVFRSRAP